MKHTPGPWSAIHQVYPTPRSILVHKSIDDEVPFTHENVRLMAAAPCMLGLLERILDHLKQNPEFIDQVEWPLQDLVKALEIAEIVSRARGSK